MAYKKIAVLGLGYIGLPTAAVIASCGIDVTGIDVSPEVVDIINDGEIHIVEPDLAMLVKSAVATGKFKATISIESADVFIIAVPTPLIAHERKPDLSFLEIAADSIASVLEKGNLVILESTSPVGTTKRLAMRMAKQRPDLSFTLDSQEEVDVNFACCPERVLPGSILRELVSNDRIIGGLTKKCAKQAESFYRIFVRGKCLLTDAQTAEMCKLTENAFRDVNIAFANELSMICDGLDINPWELIHLANHHPRVNVLNPGPGVGGHCIAVDPWFIVNTSPTKARLIRKTREVNDDKPGHVVLKVKEMIAEINQPVIALLGLTYKADVDDLRQSPALEVVRTLAMEKLGRLLVVEPYLSGLPKDLTQYENLEKVDLDIALEQAEVVVLLVDHRQFSNLQSSKLKGFKLLNTCRGWQ